MKLSTLLSLLVVAALCISTVSAAGKEVRSYVNELEYVDDASAAAAAAAQEPQPQLLEHSTAASAVSTAADSEADAFGNSFHMESDSDFSEDDSLGITTMLEIQGNEEVNTDVMRAMALEIHDAAQSALPAELEAAEAEEESFVEMDAESEDLTALSAQEVAQAIADAKADAADAAAEKADAIEAAKDAAAAGAAPATPAVPAATPAAAAPAAAPAAPAAPAAAAPVAIALPADLSVEHAETLRTSEAATFAIRGALGEVGAILAAKDDTIAGLVANTTYLAVGMSRLANQVDLQKAYISLLLKKLAIAQLKNAELVNHVALSTSTVASVRAQIASMETRLNSQDSVTAALGKFLTASGSVDSAALPAAPADVSITGSRTSYRSIRDRFVAKSRKASAARRAARAKALEERQKAYALRRAQRIARQRSRAVMQRSRRSRRAARKARTMKPVAGTTVVATAQTPQFFANKAKNNGPAPTIVVEVQDSGLIEEESE